MNETSRKMAKIACHALSEKKADDIQVIDISELPALCVFTPDKKNTIRPDSLDGYDILHLPRNFVPFFVCFQDVTDRFHHGPY